jgi:four helix bundle protein
MAFPFERLNVYRKGEDWLEEVERLTAKLRERIQPVVIDQLFRAALSITLNIAEGNGRFHPADKQKFFRIAQGSLFECAALLRLLHARKYIDSDEFLERQDQLEEMARMIAGLIRSIDQGKPYQRKA